MSEHIQEIYQRYIADTATEADMQALRNWLSDPANEQPARTLLEQSFRDIAPLYDISAQNAHSILEAIVNTDTPVKRMRNWGWAAAAAAVLLLGGTAIYLTYNKKPPAQLSIIPNVAPGKQGAVLVLSNGTQLVLDSLHNGIVANQQGAQVTLQNGQLSYGNTSSHEVAYNSVTTPNGREFSIVLPDGTKAWLNAGSSIRYPVAFDSHARTVEIKGEVYFEVAAKAGVPFHVNISDKAVIDVLGTHFNVKAYDNEENIRATLLEGSVRVQYASGSQLLQPGQQAAMPQAPGGIITIEKADIDKVMAWKNGLFDFNGASLKEVMRELERWYDIEVVYEEGVPNITFWGKMTKGVTLNDLLVALQKTEVHFRLEGRKLIVQP